MFYTLGYQAAGSIEAVARLAKEHRAAVADIRFSGKARGFHETTFRNVLATAAIRYERLPELGNKNYKNPEAGIELASPDEGYEKFMRLYRELRSVIIMCACRNLHQCHRYIVAMRISGLFDASEDLREDLPVTHLLQWPVPPPATKTRHPKLWPGTRV